MHWNNERELQDDLAVYLRSSGFLTFTELLVPGCEGGRVDVATVKPHVYATKDLRAYEVKLTKQCFLQDIGQNKWHKYLNVFHRVYFAAPEGVLKKDDIPKDAGLIVRNENGWHVTKAAKGHKPEKLNADAVFAMLYRGYEQDREIRRLSERIAVEENLPLSAKAKKIGWEISRRLDRDRESTVENWAIEVVGLMNECLGVEIRYEKNGEISLPSTWELKDVLQGISKVTKEYDTIRKIGAFLYTFGEKHFGVEKVSSEDIKKIINM